MNVVLSRQNDIRILDTKQPSLNSHQNHSHQDHCSHCQHTHESITNENKSSLSTTDESKGETVLLHFIEICSIPLSLDLTYKYKFHRTQTNTTSSE